MLLPAADVLFWVLFVGNRFWGAESIQRCQHFPDPKNGRLVCDSLFRLFCAPECNDGFTFEYKPALVYMCGPLTGDWFTYPEGEKIPWPDCLPKDRFTEDDGNQRDLVDRRAQISRKIMQTHHGLFPQTYRPADINQQDSRYHHLFDYLQRAQQVFNNKKPFSYGYPQQNLHPELQQTQAIQRQQQQLQHLQYLRQQQVALRNSLKQQQIQETKSWSPQQTRPQQRQTLNFPLASEINWQKYPQYRITQGRYFPSAANFYKTLSSVPAAANNSPYAPRIPVGYARNLRPSQVGTNASPVNQQFGLPARQNNLVISPRESGHLAVTLQPLVAGRKYAETRGQISRVPMPGSGTPTNHFMSWGRLHIPDAAPRSQGINQQKARGFGFNYFEPTARKLQNMQVGVPLRGSLNVNKNDFKNLPRKAQTADVNKLLPTSAIHTTERQIPIRATKKVHNATSQIERRGGVDEEPMLRTRQKSKTKEKLFYFPIKRDTLINMLPVGLRERYKLLKRINSSKEPEQANHRNNDNKQEPLLPGIKQTLHPNNISHIPATLENNSSYGNHVEQIKVNNTRTENINSPQRNFSRVPDQPAVDKPSFEQEAHTWNDSTLIGRYFSGQDNLFNGTYSTNSSRELTEIQPINIVANVIEEYSEEP